MQKLLIFILFFCGCYSSAISQTVPPAGGLPGNANPLPGTSPLPNVSSTQAGYQRKIDARKDSALSTLQHYVSPGAAPGKNKASGKSDTTMRVSNRSVKLASTAADAPEPVRMFPSLDRNSCKAVTFLPEPQTFVSVPLARTPQKAAVPSPHVPFLQIHGNVLYNLNYYSLIDTPYSEKNIYQHTIQTWLDVLVKGQYPFRIFLTNHFSNSPLFRNYSDFNFSYNNSGFSQQLKNQIRNEFLQSLPSPKVLDSLERLLNNDWQKLKGLQGWEKNPALIQKMIEARELAMRKPSAKSDSSASSAAGIDSSMIKDQAELDSLFANKKRDEDSLRKEIGRLQQLLQTAHQQSQADVNRALCSIQQAGNPAQLHKEMQALGMSDSSLPKGYKTLMAIKSFNLGRTVVNYSELSAKNISVNGVQAEYNPSNYYAIASGSINYRFRDFIMQDPGQPHQYLNVFRIGKGTRDGNSVILTYFTGRRQLYNAATTDSPAVSVPSSSLMGITLEGNYRINKNILFTGEIAKSSSPAYTGDSTKGHGLASQLFQLNDHSNEAWSMKANAFFPETQTRVKASFKHLAANYQSFSIFTDGSAQSAWSASIDQLLFRKQLDLMVGANTNDFSNPFIGQEYSSKTVFKSIQATWRRRNWPVISFGYFPSSQITKLGTSQYIENLFYTMVGNMTYSYTYHHLSMNTTLVYTAFYNKASDSGFTYFNTRNLMLGQTVFLNKFTLQLNATGATSQDYQLYTLEGRVQHTVSKALTVGVGVKYNDQTVYNIQQWGYSAEAALRLNKLGQLQLSADNGFVPGMNKHLMPDNTGRLTYIKTF